VTFTSLLKLLVALVLGLALGLGATWASLDKGIGFGLVRAGPWIAFPKAGSRGADPYARAALSRTGELPLDLAEGLAFTARWDSEGAALEAACAYRIEGPAPQARYWTLSALSADGRLVANAAERLAFTSAEIVRPERGGWSVRVGRQAQPGNWLPYGGQGPFQIVLRLYDTPVSATAASLRANDLPRIVREGCA